jgi:hypothetical protein
MATPVAAARSGRPRPRHRQGLLLIDLLAGVEGAEWRVVETGGNPWSCLDHDGDGACLPDGVVEVCHYLSVREGGRRPHRIVVFRAL